ncbi:MAG: phosphate ABC transporter substrate-binding protein PstS [Microbacteriaceae bacterium]
MNTVLTRKRALGLAAAAISGTIILAGCAANESGDSTTDDSSSASLSGTLNGMGSSAQSTAETAWIAGFQTENPDVTVNYDPQGSGTGRQAFIAGSVDFAGSDAALSDDELSGTFALCVDGTSAIDLPVYISPIAIAYNVDGLDELKLDAETIAGIFKGEITEWDDPAIAALNEDVTLPSETINVIHRSDDSGTTQNFTEYLVANASDVWDADASQTYPYSVGDAAKGTSGVADALSATANSITYIDDSGVPDGIGKAELKVGDAYSTISADGAAEVVAASPLVDGRADNDLAIAIDRTDTEENAWPLVLVSYLIACQQYQDSDTATLVRSYIEYVAGSDAQAAGAEAAGSAALSDELSATVEAAAATIE